MRELANILEHACVKCQGAVIQKRHLPAELAAPREDVVALALMAENPLAALERELIQRVLEDCGGKAQLAAKRLGISRITLWRKLRAARAIVERVPPYPATNRRNNTNCPR